MILTLTPNPSVDRTIAIPLLARGTVSRATSTRDDPGGKGINVSRALVAHGADTCAVLPVGGSTGRTMVELLLETGTPVVTVPIREPLRSNVTVVEPDGTTTKLNEPGPTLDRSEADALIAAVASAYDESVTWVVGCGSLPPGVSPDLYDRLVRDVHGYGGKVVIDTSGAALRAAVLAGPDLVKPNRAELAELAGRDLDSLRTVVDASRDLLRHGVGQVLVSLGRDGAALITPDEVLTARATVDRPLSTVGAGDCTMAGYLLAVDRGATPAEALSTAVAFGAAAVALPGSAVPDATQVAAVTVVLDDSPDPDMPLSD